MKILVLSDSHSSLSFMRRAIKAVKPDAVVHLGDHYDDAMAMAEEFFHIPFHCVPGNCDRYRINGQQPLVLCYDVCGVRLFMTHGHLQSVKSSLYRLLAEGKSMGAQCVLYGHTHSSHCEKEDGLWILNPGSCGYGGKTAGLITVSGNEITECKILNEFDLEE